VVTSMLDARNDARNEGGAYQRVEVITGRQRRRRWTAEEKARIVAESLEADANISDVARRHGVARGLLTIWRRQLSSGGEGREPAQSFAAVKIATVARRQTVSHVIQRNRMRWGRHCRQSGAEGESRLMLPGPGSGLRAALITRHWPWCLRRCGATSDLVPGRPEDHVGRAACRFS
jgi:transposase-like protein